MPKNRWLGLAIAVALTAVSVAQVYAQETEPADARPAPASFRS